MLCNMWTSITESFENVYDVFEFEGLFFIFLHT